MWKNGKNIKINWNSLLTTHSIQNAYDIIYTSLVLSYFLSYKYNLSDVLHTLNYFLLKIKIHANKMKRLWELLIIHDMILKLVLFCVVYVVSKQNALNYR